MAEENIIILGFSDSSKAYEALSRLGDLDSRGDVTVVESAVISRKQDGTTKVEAGSDNESGLPTVTGGLVGALIGLLGGPVGAAVGWGAGTVTGSLIDVGSTADRDTLMSKGAEIIAPSSNGLVAEVIEDSHQPIDALAGNLGGVVVRASVAEVEDELEAADAEARRIDREKRSTARKERLDAFKSKVSSKVSGAVEDVKKAL